MELNVEDNMSQQKVLNDQKQLDNMTMNSSNQHSSRMVLKIRQATKHESQTEPNREELCQQKTTNQENVRKTMEQNT
jgi:hypothetical protein